VLLASSTLPDGGFTVLHFVDAAILTEQHERDRYLLGLFVLAGLLVVLAIERSLDTRARRRAHAVAVDAAHRKLHQMAKELHQMAVTDALTGAANRRAFMGRLSTEVDRAARTTQPLAVLMLDIDHFKKINDTFGHPAGDAVIKALARACERQVRPYDLVARLGGEEFAVLLPNADQEIACIIAERIRVNIEGQTVEADGHSIRHTVSIGVAMLSKAMAHELGADDLLKAADLALYEAKHGGRNRVCLAGTHAS
jgi:diguanylate cyclase (GGDEF)-like protein